MDSRAFVSSEEDAEIQDVDLWSFIHPYLTKYKERNAFICQKTGTNYTYGDVYDMALRWANFLEQNFPNKSPSIVIFTSNLGIFPILYYGTLAVGGVVCPLMENYPEELLAYIVNTVEADVILVEDYLLPLTETVIKRLGINPQLFVIGKDSNMVVSVDSITNSLEKPHQVLKQVDPSSAAFVFFSSGTTGEPKGIVQSHRSLCSLSWMLKKDHFYPDPPSDGSQCFYTTSYPMAHVGSVFLFTIIPLLLGDCTVVLDFRDVEGINTAIQNFKMKVAFLRPFYIKRLLELPNAEDILASVKHVATIGSNPDLQTELELLKRVPHLKFQEAYGLTETLLVTGTPSGAGSVVDGTVPFPGGTVSIRDVKTGAILNREEQGMIHLKSPWLMNGYLKKPDVTKSMYAKDGHLNTGDLGYITQDGRLVVVGREIDLMVVDGKKVIPSVLEENLIRHPSVLEVAVIGTPHITKGQVPKAFVVAKDERASPMEIQKFCDDQARMPEEKLTGGVTLIDNLPRNPLGKVLKKELRRMDWGEGS